MNSSADASVRSDEKPSLEDGANEEATRSGVVKIRMAKNDDDIRTIVGMSVDIIRELPVYKKFHVDQGPRQKYWIAD